MHLDIGNGVKENDVEDKEKSCAKGVKGNSLEVSLGSRLVIKTALSKLILVLLIP